ncbi:MAG: GGDEF domain-containing protein [Phycisphaeraceae bacterium]|nr:MAG: GGDEF domain-containing protein [Phycisphaeraceae bacterium]
MSAKNERSTTGQSEAAGDERSQLCSLIERSALRAVHQPIVNLSQGVITGYESLTRPEPDTGFAHIGEVFDAAARHDMLWPLEDLARKRCVESVSPEDPSLIFFNTSPRIFADPRYTDSIRTLIEARPGLSPSKVVLEITERAEAPQDDGLERQVRALKDAGFQIAIDDVGAGTSGLNRIMSLRPHWLKLDRELVDHIDSDPYRQNLLSLFVHFAKSSGVQLVAEGIEREEELMTLIELGIHYGQGYLLGRPGRRDQTLDGPLLRRIREHSALADRSRRRDPSVSCVDELMRRPLICDARTPVVQAMPMLLADPLSAGLVVVDGRRYVGWCTREALLSAAAGASPHTHVGHCVRSPGVSVDPGTPLVEALRLVSSRAGSDIVEPLIIADRERVQGILTIQDLLKAAVRLAGGWRAGSAPMTGLPGRVECDQRLANILAQEIYADAVFIDIIGFYRFNKRFGHEMGDLLLRIVSGLITTTIMGSATSDQTLLAHLGDDRFLVVRLEGSVDRDIQLLLTEFEMAVRQFLDIATHPDGDQNEVGAGVEPNSEDDRWGLRAVLIPDIASHARHPRDLYALAAQLHRKRPDITAGGSMIIMQSRAGDESREAA